METFVCLVLLIALGVVILRRFLAEFPAQKPGDYAKGTPVFDIKKHLNGKMVCEGVIFGPLGRVTSSFVASMDIIWDGDVGVLKEHFRYDDGSEQDREWTITLGQGGAFRATATDFVGVAQGKMAGSAMQWRYRIKLPQEAGGHVLDTIDWMYLTPEGTIMNRSQFRKFGVRVAELVATIRPAP